MNYQDAMGYATYYCGVRHQDHQNICLLTFEYIFHKRLDGDSHVARGQRRFPICKHILCMVLDIHIRSYQTSESSNILDEVMSL